MRTCKWFARCGLLCLAALPCVQLPAGLAQQYSPPFGGVNTGKVAQSDPFLGDWQGRWVQPKPKALQLNPSLVAQIIPRGGGRYQINILPEFDQRCAPYAVVHARAEGGKIEFAAGDWSGTVTAERFEGEGALKTAKGHFVMEKVTRLSPTLGAAPPPAAVVLFDGSGFDQWEPTGRSGQQTITWQLAGGAMTIDIGSGGKRHGLRSRRRFGDLKLHIEFRLPLEPENTGQARANSGVFIGPYEIQVLDSYGLPGYYNECGALYKLAAPMVNMCAPPLQWQTYDAIYRAPRFSDDGRLLEPACMTVLHNGKVIHRDQPLVHHTANAQTLRHKPIPNEPVAISLQNHGHPVQFRNIWVVPLGEAAATLPAS